MTVRAEMAQVKSAALSGSGTVSVVVPALKTHQAAGSADAAHAKPSKLSDYLCLTKPEVTFLVLIATALSGFMAAESPDLLVLCHAVFGTALVAGGTAALNHYLEREHDGKMRRTAHRPLPSGRLSAREALGFGTGISVAGTVYLAVLVNWLTSFLGLATLLSYLCIYTPLKRRTTWATFVGAFPGAAPVLMGWAAVRGSLSVEAWALYAFLFVWQFPHFLAIAWMYREDYARAGMLMLPAEDPRGDVAFRQILGYSVALIPVSLLPTLLGMTGSIYLWAVAILGLAFLSFARQVSRERTKTGARMLLHVTVIYQPLVYALMVANK
ncbi:MAG TPA: heme o synthase, partial [Terriglobia bacterium]|nr:heme o synthase [Terriglobia bacterium]